MIHTYRTKVYYADTDAYGVAWHGTYIRWMEVARTEFCASIGQTMKSIEDKGFVTPVVNLNIKYKVSAKLHDNIVIETKIIEYKKVSMKFSQIIKNEDTGRICAEATIDVVAVDKNTGKLLRTMPFDGIEDLIEE